MSRTKRFTNSRNTPQLPARTTRSRGKVQDANPEETGKQLEEQLRALGLYPAPTLGDGNCLFRALSDQLHGSPSGHGQLRDQVCNWIHRNAEMYAPFCDDERGLDAHLRAMRQPATYGGHMELTAFAHMTGRDVKVVQPGLVYVIEANAFGGSPDPPPPLDPNASEPALNSRDARKSRRERVKEEKARARVAEEAAVIAAGDDPDDSEPTGPVYVAYHDWEHFSSIRNLVGPHAGLPRVRERPAPNPSSGTTSPSSPKRTKPLSSTKASSSTKPRSKLASSSASLPLSSSVHVPTSSLLSTAPTAVPLPPSRSTSPMPGSTPPSRSDAPHLREHGTGYRSPKRTFDESSCSSMDAGDPATVKDSTAGTGHAKRARSRRRPSEMNVNEPEVGGGADYLPSVDPTGEGDHTLRGRLISVTAPSSSAPSSSATPAATSPPPSSRSRSRSSSLSSVPSTPPPPTPASTPGTPKYTRRERKRLGLPKEHRVRGGSAGTIRIPGGRMRRPTIVAKKEEEERDQEWVKNGSGRMDARGFRELKI